MNDEVLNSPGAEEAKRISEAKERLRKLYATRVLDGEIKNPAIARSVLGLSEKFTSKELEENLSAAKTAAASFGSGKAIINLTKRIEEAQDIMATIATEMPDLPSTSEETQESTDSVPGIITEGEKVPFDLGEPTETPAPAEAVAPEAQKNTGLDSEAVKTELSEKSDLPVDLGGGAKETSEQISAEKIDNTESFDLGADMPDWLFNKKEVGFKDKEANKDAIFVTLDIRGLIDKYLVSSDEEREKMSSDLRAAAPLIDLLGLAEDFTQEELKERYDLFVEVIDEYFGHKDYLKIKDELQNSANEGFNSAIKSLSVEKANLEGLENIDQPVATEQLKAKEISEGLDRDYDEYVKDLNKKIENKRWPKEPWARFLRNSSTRMAAGVIIGITASSFVNTPGGAAAKYGAMALRTGLAAFGFGSGAEAGKMARIRQESLSLFDDCKVDGKIIKVKVVEKLNALSPDQRDRTMASLLEVSDRRAEKINEKLYQEEQEEIAKAEKTIVRQKFDKLRDDFSKLSWKKKLAIGGVVALVSAGAGAVAGGALAGVGVYSAASSVWGIGVSGLINVGASFITSSKENKTNYSADSELIDVLGHEYFQSQDFDPDRLQDARTQVGKEIVGSRKRGIAFGVVFANAAALISSGVRSMGHHGGEEQVSTGGSRQSDEPDSPYSSRDENGNPRLRPETGPYHKPPMTADGKVDVERPLEEYHATREVADAAEKTGSAGVSKSHLEHGSGAGDHAEKAKVTVTRAEADGERPSTVGKAEAAAMDKQADSSKGEFTRTVQPGEERSSQSPASEVASHEDIAPKPSIPGTDKTPEHLSAIKGSHDLVAEKALAGGSLKGHDGGKMMQHIYDGLEGKNGLPETGAENEAATVQAMTEQAKKLGIIDSAGNLTDKINDPDFDPQEFTRAVVGHDNNYLSNLNSELEQTHVTVADGESRHEGASSPEQHAPRSDAENRAELEKTTGNKTPATWKIGQNFEAYNNGKSITEAGVMDSLDDKNISKDSLNYMKKLIEVGALDPKDVRVSEDGKQLMIHMPRTKETVWTTDIKGKSLFSSLFPGKTEGIKSIFPDQKIVNSSDVLGNEIKPSYEVAHPTLDKPDQTSASVKPLSDNGEKFYSAEDASADTGSTSTGKTYIAVDDPNQTPIPEANSGAGEANPEIISSEDIPYSKDSLQNIDTSRNYVVRVDGQEPISVPGTRLSQLVGEANNYFKEYPLPYPIDSGQGKESIHLYVLDKLGIDIEKL